MCWAPGKRRQNLQLSSYLNKFFPPWSRKPKKNYVEANEEETEDEEDEGEIEKNEEKEEEGEACESSDVHCTGH